MVHQHILASIATLLLLIQSTIGTPHRAHQETATLKNDTASFEAVCHASVTVIDRKTVLSTVTLPKTAYVEVTVPHYANTTITECFTEISRFTVNVTETDTDTVEVTETETDTVEVTKTNTATDTITTTDTVPATVTTYSTKTIIGTSYDPCPKSCSVDAATVTVFFWPTDRPHHYPATYVDKERDYTFISPSVYLLIPSAKGTNTKGEWVGPSTTNWILPLDIEDVSTIADGPSGSLTRQLQLSDLGTDCPQSMDETAIATLSDSRCAPILAAPTQVSSWAHPCNACGPFGLFDPPYAIPTATGGLLDPITKSETSRELTATKEAEPSKEPKPAPAPPSEEAPSIDTQTIHPSSSTAPGDVAEETIPAPTGAVSAPDGPAPVPVPGTPSPEIPMLPTPSGPEVVTGGAAQLSGDFGWAASVFAVSVVFMHL